MITVDKIIKKQLNITDIDNDTIIDDPFLLASIGVQIEEETELVLSDEDFMKNQTIGDVKRSVKWL